MRPRNYGSNTVTAVLSAALLATGCSAPQSDFPWAPPPDLTTPHATTDRPPPPPIATEPPATTSGTPRSSQSSSAGSELDESFSSMAAGLPGTVTVTVAGAGPLRSYGAEPGAVAWSTIKVALSIAAMRADAAAAQASMLSAITLSDNDAATRLWDLLGSPAQASAAVEGVLAEGGSPANVPVTAPRPPYTPFGQTEWPGAQAATFALNLPCIAGAGVVLDQMRQLGANQAWGLAGDPGVAAKGGWGPEPDGKYLVRQIAVVPTDQGTLGVSLIAVADDGVLATGTTMVDKLADWVRAHTKVLAPQGGRDCV